MNENLKPDESIEFMLDGSTVAARPGETIWQVAKRHGNELPHLCFKDAPGYRADGNCRACMVEIEGEGALAAACIRNPTPGMVVTGGSGRALQARKNVIDLLIADQPDREHGPDRNSRLWRWADELGVSGSRYPARAGIEHDASHPAMCVRLDACIQCNLCLRACREVQVNDVIGMAYRGHASRIVFDFDDPMGASTCVGFGECVQACPTGALMEKSLVDDKGEDKRIPVT